jgi:hypothetical protein
VTSPAASVRAGTVHVRFAPVGDPPSGEVDRRRRDVHQRDGLGLGRGTEGIDQSRDDAHRFGAALRAELRARDRVSGGVVGVPGLALECQEDADPPRLRDQVQQ